MLRVIWDFLFPWRYQGPYTRICKHCGYRESVYYHRGETKLSSWEQIYPLPTKVPCRWHKNIK